MKIQEISIDDWEILRDVRLRALSESPFAFGSSFEVEKDWGKIEWIQKFDDRAWFIASDKEKIGIAGWYKDLDLEEGEYYLSGMWVTPKFRGSDVSLKLVDHVKNDISTRNGNKLSLLMTQNNPRAFKFYIKAGFSIVETNIHHVKVPHLTLDKMSMSL